MLSSLLGLALLAFLGLGGYLFFTRKRKGRGEDSLNVAVWSADNLRKALNVISGGQTTITDESIRVLQGMMHSWLMRYVKSITVSLGDGGTNETATKQEEGSSPFFAGQKGSITIDVNLLRGESLRRVLGPQLFKHSQHEGAQAVSKAKPCTMPITVVMPLADALGRYCESAATRSAVAGGNKVNVSQECGLYTAGIIDYLLSELLELSSYKARDRSSDSKELKITPEDVTKAVEFDEELRLVFGEAGAEKTSAEEKG